ncbi:MAG: phosphoenolpyruvate-utilizing N-terminal domain-containing protein, partial [Thermoanaerobaculia bacterium]
MMVKKGIPVSPGIAIGAALVLGTDELRAPRRAITRGEAEGELKCFDRAVAQATREIQEEIERL